MYCKKCGAKFPDVYVYCPECGEEAHVLSQEDLLEEDILEGFIDDEDTPVQEGLVRRITPYEDKTREVVRKKKEEARNRKLKKTLLVLFIIIAIIAAAGTSYVSYSRNHSVEYQMTKAQNAYDTKDYVTAREALDKVLSLDENNVDALLLAGRIDAVMKNYEQAETLLKKAISLDPMNKDAYTALISVYDKQGQRAKILELMETTHNQEIRALFADYAVPVPVIEPEGGTFDDDQSVSITAENDKLKIYYTLDGTQPDQNSTLYTEPVLLEGQKDYVLTAVCLDEEGFYSDPVEASYRIHYNTPAMPSVSPDGGQYTSPVRITVTAPEGTTVYYTWNGSEPDESCSACDGTLTVPEGNNILSLVAIDKHGMKSGVLKCNYIYYPQVRETDRSEQESSDGSAEQQTEHTQTEDIQGTSDISGSEGSGQANETNESGETGESNGVEGDRA